MANEFIARNGLIAQQSSVVTGSLTVTNGITGSLFGTATTASYVTGSIFTSTNPALSASYALTASHVLNLQPASADFGGIVTTGTQTFAGAKTFNSPTEVPITALSVSEYAIFAATDNNVAIFAQSVNGGAVYGTTDNGIGVEGSSTNNYGIKGISGGAAGGVFETNVGSNIAEFKAANVLKAYITSTGTTVANKSLIGTTVDNGVDNLQVNGSATITGSLGVTAGITGSLFGTASFVTGSIFTTTNRAANATSALTASHVNPLVQDVRITGSLNVSGSTSLNGLSTVTGTTASDSPPLGSELLTVSNWTTTGWTGDFTTGFTHTTGNTSVLSNTLAAVIGTYYKIQITMTGRTAGSITIDFGGQSRSVSSTRSSEPLATTTGNLTITPTSDFDGTILVSTKTIGLASPTLTINPSVGTGAITMRATNVQSNTIIGLQAGQRLSSNGTGNDGATNTFIGFNSGRNSTISRGCTFIGSTAGQNNVTGESNTYVGTDAGFASTTGIFNTAIGTNSLQNSTGNTNTAIGTQALQNNTTGNNNTAIGVSAGRTIADGTTANAISTDSIFIGTGTRALANNQSNQNVIGVSAIGLGSNTTVLGNTSTATTAIYGDLLLGQTIDNGTDKLQVTGNVTISGSLRVTAGITGSLFGTSSYVTGSIFTSANLALSSSQAISSSYVTGSIFTSANPALSASYALTASYALNGGSGGAAGLKTKSGGIVNSSFTGNPKKSTVTFSTAFTDTNYGVTVTGEDARSWTIESKVAGSFIISTNSNTGLSGTTFWQAVAYGETT